MEEHWLIVTQWNGQHRAKRAEERERGTFTVPIKERETFAFSVSSKDPKRLSGLAKRKARKMGIDPSKIVGLA